MWEPSDYPQPFDVYTLPALPGISLTILFSIIGIFGNLNIILATDRKRRLRSRCNIFIAINAGADVLHQTGHIIFAFYYLLGDPFRPLEYVFYLYIPAVMGANMGAPLMFVISFDRLFCVLFPVKYEKIPRHYYLAMLLAIPITQSNLIMYQNYQGMTKNRNMLVVCSFVQTYTGDDQHVWRYMQVIFCVLIIACYTFIWFYLNHNQEAFLKTVKPLSLITISQVSCWLMATGVQYIFMPSGLNDPGYIFLLQMNGGWQLNMGLASNYFAYFLNKDYRMAFLEQLDVITCGYINSRKRRTKVSVLWKGTFNSANMKTSRL
ncbi:unnamed protein product [Bursaphelenchus xylophilus]|uniref:(pine wood nematode) hypothetical protein n=1 Tax=Bursaphelenchus xylophilus TaxID=6326 RepID=A0A1I7RN10_BURXY|nr:unnamed protein product [Bursaphelenchus xylophilus]CAG9125284.1 unnamed protein product [Bursaphelenchus xylophilus]